MIDSGAMTTAGDPVVCSHVADATTADRMARAFLSDWAKRFFVGSAVLLAVPTVLAILTGRWAWLVAAMVWILGEFAFKVRRTKKQYRATVPPGARFETEYRGGTVIVRAPGVTTELPLASVGALRVVGDFVVLAVAKQRVRPMLPLDLFPHEQVLRAQQGPAAPTRPGHAVGSSRVDPTYPTGWPHQDQSTGRGWRIATLVVVGVVVLAVVGTFAYRKLSPGPTYAFLHTQPNSSAPIGFDPCRPVEYVVYTRDAPPGTEGLLDSAIEEISDATGLKFSYRGPWLDPRLQKPASEGTPREPVVIAWVKAEDVKALKDRVLGVGGSNYAWNAERGEFEYVRGVVAIDADDAAGLLEKVNGRDWVRALIMHELGHVLGLAHVKARDQLMYPYLIRTDLGLGDRAGLAALGAGRCHG